MKRYGIAVLASLIAACASQNVTDGESAQLPMFNLSITDSVEQQQFELLLRSSDSRPLCLDVEQWPNRLGQVDWRGRQGVLKSQEGSFSAEDANFGFCPSGCGVIKIAPHGEHRGFVAYSEFGDPTMIAKLHNRQLEFTVVPRVCTRKEIE